MVVAMAVYDQTPGAARPRTEGGDGLGLPPPVVPCEAPDWRSLYEQQRVRADALQARVKELTWAETSARSHAGMLKWNLARTRAQLEAAHGEVKEVRRDAQQGLFFKSQVARLEALLEEAGVETSRRSTMMSLRQDVFRLKKDLKAATAWHREVASLKRATVRQGETIKELRARCAEQEADLARLRGTRATLSKAAFGSKSEKQKKEGTGKKRGQQRGASGHGRTPRPSLPENEERHDPPASERVCPCCGEPYVANGEHVSSVHEIEVKAHTRKIVRGRWRRSCQCPSSPQEVTAPPPLRLFPRTPYGISVWERVLYERYACFRPLRRVSRWMAEQGLPMAPGTMAGAMKSLAPMFAPLASAILDHHNDMTVRHGDETGWRIQSLKTSGRSQRAWMWNSVSADSVFFHIDPSRSAAVAKKLFGSTRVTVFLVCDRYSAYKKLARELAGKVILCLCWTHARRDVIEAAGWPGRTGRLERQVACQDRGDLPGEHGAVDALRPRTGTPDIDVRRTAGRPCGGCRGAHQAGADGTRRLAGRRARSEGAAFPDPPPRGTERLRRPSPGSDGQLRSRAPLPRSGNRASAELRVRQRGVAPPSRPSCTLSSAPLP